MDPTTYCVKCFRNSVVPISGKIKFVYLNVDSIKESLPCVMLLLFKSRIVLYHWDGARFVSDVTAVERLGVAV